MTIGKASSYGDKRDMKAYNTALIVGLRMGLNHGEAKARARKVGDPGIGWADNNLSTDTPWVAVPYEYWKKKFGTKAKAHCAKLKVIIGGKTVECVLGDTMPHLKNITNGAVIDLAPGAQKAFGLTPPFLVNCTWEWV